MNNFMPPSEADLRTACQGGCDFETPATPPQRRAWQALAEVCEARLARARSALAQAERGLRVATCALRKAQARLIACEEHVRAQHVRLRSEVLYRDQQGSDIERMLARHAQFDAAIASAHDDVRVHEERCQQARTAHEDALRAYRDLLRKCEKYRLALRRYNSKYENHVK